MYISKAIARVIEKRPEIVGKVITTVRQRCQEILEMFPSSNIQLLWIE